MVGTVAGVPLKSAVQHAAAVSSSGHESVTILSLCSAVRTAHDLVQLEKLETAIHSTVQVRINITTLCLEHEFHIAWRCTLFKIVFFLFTS